MAVTEDTDGAERERSRHTQTLTIARATRLQRWLLLAAAVPLDVNQARRSSVVHQHWHSVWPSSQGGTEEPAAKANGQWARPRAERGQADKDRMEQSMHTRTCTIYCTVQVVYIHTRTDGRANPTTHTHHHTHARPLRSHPARPSMQVVAKKRPRPAPPSVRANQAIPILACATRELRPLTGYNTGSSCLPACLPVSSRPRWKEKDRRLCPWTRSTHAFWPAAAVSCLL